MAAWTHNGKALDLLDPQEDYPLIAEWDNNDITSIMDLFSRVPAVKAYARLPSGLEPRETRESVSYRIRASAAMMKGRIPIDEDTYSEEDKEGMDIQDLLDGEREWKLQKENAKIARDKLDAMTGCGERKMTPEEWKDFVAVWDPRFYHLSRREFRGKWHYVRTENPSAPWDGWDDYWDFTSRK